MTLIQRGLRRIPEPLRGYLIHHRELLKFALVGGTTFIIDTVIFLILKTTVLEPKPITAKVIATLLATIVSYVLNREWSFRTRGGRERHHEATLFFVISGIAVVLNTIPLGVSRYVFGLAVPQISAFGEQIADLVSAQIIGTLIAMVFRYWAFRKFVFPDADGRKP